MRAGSVPKILLAAWELSIAEDVSPRSESPVPDKPLSFRFCQKRYGLFDKKGELSSIRCAEWSIVSGLVLLRSGSYG
jgi:hypothetical protein